MRFNDFMESVYMIGKYELDKEYTSYTKAKLTASHELVSIQQFILKQTAKIHLLGHFLLIKLHLVKPLPTAMEIFKSNQPSKPEVSVEKVNAAQGMVDGLKAASDEAKKSL